MINFNIKTNMWTFSKDALEQRDDEVRAEVIEEFFNNIKSICNKNCNECIFCIDETCEIACIKEKLKELNK